MNTAEIINLIDRICQQQTSDASIDDLMKVEHWIRENDAEWLKKRLSRFSELEGLTDKQLATLAKFQRGHECARVGRKSTVKEVKSHIEFYWDWFLKIPAAWREKMEEIEREYPKSVVYKALKMLCSSSQKRSEYE
jgi:hypothetical protein